MSGGVGREIGSTDEGRTRRWSAIAMEYEEEDACEDDETAVGYPLFEDGAD